MNTPPPLYTQKKQQGDTPDGASTPTLDLTGTNAEVRGFRFDVLMKRKPQRVAELHAFREHLLESALEDDTVKVCVWVGWGGECLVYRWFVLLVCVCVFLLVWFVVLVCMGVWCRGGFVVVCMGVQHQGNHPIVL